MCEQAKEAAKEAKRIQIAEQKRIQIAEPEIDTVHSGIVAIAAAAVKTQSLSCDLPSSAVAQIDISLSRKNLMVSTKNKTSDDDSHHSVESPSILLSSEAKITCSNGSPVVTAAAICRISGEANISISEIRSTPIDAIGSEHVENFRGNTSLDKNIYAVAVDDPMNMDAGDDNSVLIGSEKTSVDNQAKWLAVVLSSVQKVSHPEVRVGP